MQHADPRRHCERRLNALDRERTTWFAHWRELSDFIMPRRGSFLGRLERSSERGGKRNPKLLDATAMLAARTLASGLMAGLTSPARPWFTLGLGTPALSAVPEVRAWLDDVAARMMRTIARSNLYNALAIAYEEAAVFGTAAVLVVEDPRGVVRAYPFSAGDYWLAASGCSRHKAVPAPAGYRRHRPDFWTWISGHISGQVPNSGQSLSRNARKSLWNQQADFWTPISGQRRRPEIAPSWSGPAAASPG